MGNQPLARITEVELAHLVACFADYASNGTKIAELDTCKEELGQKYHFDPKKVTINAIGEVHPMENCG